MRKQLFIILSILALVASCKGKTSATSTDSEAGEGTPLDSIYCRDPFIVADSSTKTYYLYRSSTTPEGFGGVEAFTSKDLKTWRGPERVFTVPEDNFITGRVWAPEVHYYKGAWYLFATINTDKTWAEGIEGWPAFTYRGTQVFRAESPAGPFLPLGKELTTPKEYMALDGTLWVEDGTPYMVFCHEWVQVVDGTFEVMPLKDDLSAADGDPVILFSASQADWTTGGSYWTEKDGTKRKSYVSDGNFVYKTKDGELLILWSSFKDGKYCVAIARSASGKLAGPWSCDPDPIFEEDGGHPMVFRDFDGGLNLTFHQPNSGHSHPVILPLEDTGKTLVIKK